MSCQHLDNVHKELKSKPKQSFAKKTVNRKHTKEELEYHEKGLFLYLVLIKHMQPQSKERLLI